MVKIAEVLIPLQLALIPTVVTFVVIANRPPQANSNRWVDVVNGYMPLPAEVSVTGTVFLVTWVLGFVWAKVRFARGDDADDGA